MMRRACFALPIILFASQSRAQLINGGSFNRNVYTNRDMKFAYSLPSGLVPIPISNLNVKVEHPNPNELPLFAAKYSAEPFGIVAIAEKMRMPTSHNLTGFVSGADFLRHIEPSWPPAEQLRVIKRLHTNKGGRTFDELDYFVRGEFQSGIVFPVSTANGDFLVVFKCNAKTLGDLNRMNQSVFAVSAP